MCRQEVNEALGKQVELIISKLSKSGDKKMWHYNGSTPPRGISRPTTVWLKERNRVRHRPHRVGEVVSHTLEVASKGGSCRVAASCFTIFISTDAGAGSAACDLVIPHGLKPLAVEGCGVEVQRRLETCDLGITHPASLLSLWAVFWMVVHVGKLRVPDRRLDLVENLHGGIVVVHATCRLQPGVHKVREQLHFRGPGLYDGAAQPLHLHIAKAMVCEARGVCLSLAVSSCYVDIRLVRAVPAWTRALRSLSTTKGHVDASICFQYLSILEHHSASLWQRCCTECGKSRHVLPEVIDQGACIVR
mmetsp:Transcript_39490/g.71907  ORF Transcript_39490/g.71907 Transcript_39490/m.71907 type:complete len:304 (-) Transcript_39490:599-1510(-)